jgi:lysine decarboxylase
VVDSVRDGGGQPLVDAWLAARQRRMHPLQVPGHKYRYSHGDPVVRSDALAALVRDDVALQGGADDNYLRSRVLEQAEALWAEAVHADHSRFLVGGSSQGNIASLTVVGGPQAVVALDRTSHRSAHSGLVLSGARPVWVYPRIHPELGLPLGLEPAALDGLPDEVTAVFLTTPSYVGTIADVGALATRAHAHDRVLIADQAWGAHLGFMPGRGALEQGADISTTSVHKALMGYSQTAVTSVRGPLVGRERLDRAVDLTATTSPSATLLASIDATRAVMLELGESALDRAITSVEAMRARLRQVPGLVVVDERELARACDPLKLTLWLPRTGCDGSVLADLLWQRGHGVETADADTLVITMSMLDEPQFCVQIAQLLVELVEAHRGPPRAPAPAALWQVVPEVVVSPREAFYAPRRRIPLAEAAGEISAEQFCPYPPGVPLLAPGERVTEQIIEDIVQAGRIGRVAYCSDRSLRTIEVLA